MQERIERLRLVCGRDRSAILVIRFADPFTLAAEKTELEEIRA